MKRVAVLGGGPAGAFAAERLASAGLDVILVDEKLAWEKPCGGGLTYKAYSQYPFLLENDTPKKVVTHARLNSAKSGTAAIELTRPLLIYSRFDLNAMLLRRAERAGAAIEKTRVSAAEWNGRSWQLRTKTGAIEADYCIIATGARNPLREVGTQWTPGDTMSSLGYFIPEDQDHVDLEFFPRFEGYIWIFPRAGHLSAGIAGKGKPATELRAMLDRYLQDKGISTRNSTYYGHVIPSLERSSWRENRVSGEGWMAVGDAAGLVDPVTGEGLYYALRSADLASGLLVERTEAAGGTYRQMVWREFGEDLSTGARLSKRLFHGEFLRNDMSARMIQLMKRSPTIRAVVQDLFAGTQEYRTLKARLKSSLSRTTMEIALSLLPRARQIEPHRS